MKKSASFFYVVWGLSFAAFLFWVINPAFTALVNAAHKLGVCFAG